MNNPPKYYDGYTEYGDDNIGPRLCDAAGGLEAVREKYGFIPWVCVEGYKTSLSIDKIKKLLTKHFSECGRIDEIDVPSDNKSCAYIYLAGKGSSQKAVDLTGTKVGGRKIVVSFANLPLNPTLSSTQGLYCGIGSTFPGAAYVPRNNTITYCPPTLLGQRIVAEPKIFPLPTFDSGTTFPGYVSDRPRNNTVTYCRPYGNTLPGQRILGEPKNFPGATFPAYVSDRPRNNTVTYCGPTLLGQRIVGGASFPAYVSDRPWNNTITDHGPYGNTLPGQRIVADPKNLPEVTPCTFGIGSTVPAFSSKKAEKMTEE